MELPVDELQMVEPAETGLEVDCLNLPRLTLN
jgi:hypothetical protein